MAAIANTNATAMVDLSQLSCDSILQSNGTNVPQPQGNADVAGIGVSLYPLMNFSYSTTGSAWVLQHETYCVKCVCIGREMGKRNNRMTIG